MLPRFTVGLIQKVVRWYRFNHGIGKQMLNQGAELLPCPHCGRETPVFRSVYDSAGMPISFSVCLWCDGFIEYSGASLQPHEPYATARDLQTEGQHSKPSLLFSFRVMGDVTIPHDMSTECPYSIGLLERNTENPVVGTFPPTVLSTSFDAVTRGDLVYWGEWPDQDYLLVTKRRAVYDTDSRSSESRPNVQMTGLPRLNSSYSCIASTSGGGEDRRVGVEQVT